jgi:hypothetical protein
MAVTKSRPSTLKFSQPTILRPPMRTVRLSGYDSVDRWLATADMRADLDLRTRLPDDQVMCQVFVAVIEVSLFLCPRPST